MTRMDRLVLSEIVGLFVGGVLLFSGLFFAAGELVRFADFIQRGVGLAVVGQLLLFTLPNVLAFTFPMAMLLATLLGFGRLSSDSEIVALTAAGTRFERIMVPVAAFGVVVALVGLWLNNNLAPYASRQRNVLIDKVQKGGTGNFLQAGDIFPRKFPNGKDQYLIVHANSVANLSRGELRGVSVEQWQNGALTAILSAPRAVWQVGTVNWTFFDYKGAKFFPDGSISTVRAGAGRAREYTQAIDTPTNLEYLRSRVEDTSTTLLRRRASVLRATGNEGDAREAEIEVAKRLSLPWASFAFALVGAPLGVRPARAGKGVGFGVSVVVTFCYWIALQTASVVAKSSPLPADVVVWMPNIACIALGVFLIRRVLRG